MCGIVAHVRRGAAGADPDAPALVERMVSALRYRGPDERSVTRVGDQVVFGHARLSIIDLCTGSQPIFNEDRSVAVILNGEIYNYRELRRDLEGRGHRFETASDTEAIAHLYEERGEDVFTELNGMFAIAIWDRERRRLVVGRDRLGEKPVLYAETANGLTIASEIKALLEDPALDRSIDREALALYFSSMYVPAPLTIFKSVRKLLPGHVLIADDAGVRTASYWRPVFGSHRVAPEGELVEEFRALFADAVKMRLVADVPLGAFLSGGIDSAAVGAYMSLGSTTPVRTFTMAFPNDIDERPYAREVATRYHTDHEELLLEADVDREFAQIYDYMDEPFGDSSIIPTHVISRAARERVTVALTGDGGDELFAGYPIYLAQRYRVGSRAHTGLLRAINRRAIGWAGHDIMVGAAGRSERALASWHDARSVFRDAEVNRLLGVAAAPSLDHYAAQLAPAGSLDPLDTAFAYDIQFYLPDDLLKKVDMAAMRASLECRAPFLDHRLVEWSLKLPSQLKVRGDQTKSFLKRALRGILPDSILERPKQGFGAPVESWLRNQLKDRTRDLLASGRHCDQYIDARELAAIQDAFAADSSGSDYRVASKLWLILVFETWLRRFASPARD